MSRTLSNSVYNACGASTVRLAYLVELAFDTAPLRIWSGQGNFTWAANSKTFSGLGDLLSISGVQEAQRIEANGIDLTLSGVSTAMISVVLAENYRNRRARVWLALFDNTTGTLLADPVSVFAGRIDTISLTDAGESAEVRIACESRLIDLKRARERRYTHEDQVDLYPGDLGFAYVAGLQDREIAWGKKAPV